MAFQSIDLKVDEHRARHPLGSTFSFGRWRHPNMGIWSYNRLYFGKTQNGGLKPSVDSEHFAKYLQWFHYCEEW